jgi:dienelactone hydrolase
MSRRCAALLATLLLAPIAALAGSGFPEPTDIVATRYPPAAFDAEGLMGTLTRPAERHEGRRPAVVLVHDAGGADARGDLYAEQLAGAGFLVLDLLSHPADADAVARARDWLARLPEVDAARIAGLGFGAGAQAVLRAEFAARVLLYPGCERLAPAVATAAPTLLLHGTEDPANPLPACGRAVDRLTAAGGTVRWLAYPGAGYAWDHPAIGPIDRVMLPSPLDGARVPARPWPALAEASASEVAGFLTVAFRR